MVFYALNVVRLQSAKSPHHVKKVDIVLVDQKGSRNMTLQKEVIEVPRPYPIAVFDHAIYCKNGRVIFRVTDVQY